MQGQYQQGQNQPAMQGQYQQGQNLPESQGQTSGTHQLNPQQEKLTAHP